MKKTVDFPGRTRLLIEDGRIRILLSGSTLTQTVRLSTGMDNTTGQDLAREIATQQLSAAFAHTAAPTSFDVSHDGSVLLKGLGFEILLHIDHQNALVVGAPRFLEEYSIMRAVRIIRTAVRALGWTPTKVQAPTTLYRLLSVALHPRAQVEQSNGVPLAHPRISSIEQPLIYAPSIDGFVLASKDLTEVRTATTVLNEAFGTAVRLVVVGLRLDDPHTQVMDKHLSGTTALTVVDRLHAQNVHVSLNNDLLADIHLSYQEDQKTTTLTLDSVLVRSCAGKQIEGPMSGLPQILAASLQAASTALVGPASYLSEETVVQIQEQAPPAAAPQNKTVPARTLMPGDIIVVPAIVGQQEVQQVRANAVDAGVQMFIELANGVVLNAGFEDPIALVRRTR